jgi:hypothetical protein
MSTNSGGPSKSQPRAARLLYPSFLELSFSPSRRVNMGSCAI